jgi:hypothetical protein
MAIIAASESTPRAIHPRAAYTDMTIVVYGFYRRFALDGGRKSG